MKAGATIQSVILCLLTAGCWDATWLGTQIEGDSATHDSTSPVAIDSETGTDTSSSCGVPQQFMWSSTGPLISPSEGMIDIKDPSVLHFNGQWHVYATTAIDTGTNEGDLTLTFLKLPDWSNTHLTNQTNITENAAFNGYMAAPQLFFFKPQNLWYLIFQTPEPTYATSTDPGDIQTWSAPGQLMPIPALLTDSDNQGIDYWTICDEATCYLFFTALNGTLYRASTPKTEFPEGFAGTTQIVMQNEDEHFSLFDACNVYRMAGTEKYLLLVSAIGGTGRYSRSWTADRLDGEWTPLADTEDHSFASMKNVTGADWSGFGISHGEMLRVNPDETMTINTCNMQFLFSGLAEDEKGTGYRLGLLSSSK